MLKSTKNKGFSLTFENGITISVQFGSGNYCERKNLHANYGSEMLNDIIESSDAEIAIWDEDDNWFNFGSDTVRGWCSANEVARWIYIASTSNNIDEIHHSNLPE
jgi:hypothetical protein